MLKCKASQENIFVAIGLLKIYQLGTKLEITYLHGKGKNAFKLALKRCLWKPLGYA